METEIQTKKAPEKLRNLFYFHNNRLLRPEILQPPYLQRHSKQPPVNQSIRIFQPESCIRLYKRAICLNCLPFLHKQPHNEHQNQRTQARPALHCGRA